MDFFGEALVDFSSNNLKTEYIFHLNSKLKQFNNRKSIFDLAVFFRSWSKLTLLEKKLINSSYGNILDIGSNTGYYIPLLMNKGTTTGIEISPTINSIARKKGLSNCITGDVFTYEFAKKFDTITLLGNDVALSGTRHSLKKMLTRFKNLLKNKGQVLIIVRQVQTLKYWHVVFTPEYDGRFGIPAKYLFLNAHYFISFCNKQGFEAKIIAKEGPKENLFYLLKLEKKAEA
ncbi:hypothetical protein LCGC14_1010650 [marine sediment metagenome]|uniref:Methyltransferase domain-containing protein n=1 Tax=marine sediment metagenome TaxID=412755 RepID=A0A0F9N0H1_9ZZZZ